MIASCYCFKTPILTLKIVLSPPCPLTPLSATTVDFLVKHIFSPFKVFFQCTLASKSYQWISKIWFSFLPSSWTGFVLMLPMPSLLFCMSSAMHFHLESQQTLQSPKFPKQQVAWLLFFASSFVYINWTTDRIKWLFLNWPVKSIY